jgi:hypothetical protein
MMTAASLVHAMSGSVLIRSQMEMCTVMCTDAAYQTQCKGYSIRPNS